MLSVQYINFFNFFIVDKSLIALSKLCSLLEMGRQYYMLVCNLDPAEDCSLLFVLN